MRAVTDLLTCPVQERFLMDMDELFSQVDEKRKVSVYDSRCVLVLWASSLVETEMCSTHVFTSSRA